MVPALWECGEGSADKDRCVIVGVISSRSDYCGG